ncbi:nitrite reductase small subunit NirD [Paenibacillus sp. ACRRX]|uniref:nitrite reductase small subunit NirD n=1 Tax=Paenibacillus sp. ACRRX TaxID=2918206 RepID=UPI001EF5406A|nr:nitrite reductase small subunit NirD [Paenibacillus sp. ACRRX]MCG7407294.1 nitrite reductase small subunit NirD [Paenibacillus sp. ACRRX]
MSQAVAERKVCIGKQDDFLERVGRAVEVEGEVIAVFRTSEQMYALLDRSPHPKGGPLNEGIVSGCYVYDPLYDWKIDMRDGKVQEPDTGQVQTFPLVVEGEHVYLLLAGDQLISK